MISLLKHGLLQMPSTGTLGGTLPSGPKILKVKCQAFLHDGSTGLKRPAPASPPVTDNHHEAGAKGAPGCGRNLGPLEKTPREIVGRSLTNPEEIWYTDRSSFVLDGKRRAGYAVVSNFETIEAKPLPPGKQATTCDASSTKIQNYS